MALNAFGFGKAFSRAQRAGLGDRVFNASRTWEESLQQIVRDTVLFGGIVGLLLFALAYWNGSFLLAVPVLVLIRFRRFFLGAPAADLVFHEFGIDGTWKHSGAGFLSFKAPRAVPYEWATGIELELDGRLRLSTRDAKSLKTTQLVGTIPRSKRVRAAELVDAVRRNPAALVASAPDARPELRNDGTDRSGPGKGW